MEAAAYELPYEPAVDGAEGEFAMRGVFAGVIHVVRSPVQLGGGKIRIDDQASVPAHLVLQALGARALANGFDVMVLSDDGAEGRFACGALPHYGGFALVGDAERGHVGDGELRLFKCSATGDELAVSDVERIMLHPAGLWKMLGKLPLGAGDDLAGAVKDDGV